VGGPGKEGNHKSAGEEHVKQPRTKKTVRMVGKRRKVSALEASSGKWEENPRKTGGVGHVHGGPKRSTSSGKEHRGGPKIRTN